MKAFLLVERHGIRTYGKGKDMKSEIRKEGIICAFFAESDRKVAEFTGGNYVVISLDAGLCPTVYLSKELFSPYSENIVCYEKDPIRLYIGNSEEGTYLFIVEVPFLPFD